MEINFEKLKRFVGFNTKPPASMFTEGFNFQEQKLFYTLPVTFLFRRGFVTIIKLNLHVLRLYPSDYRRGFYFACAPVLGLACAATRSQKHEPESFTEPPKSRLLWTRSRNMHMSYLAYLSLVVLLISRFRFFQLKEEFV